MYMSKQYKLWPPQKCLENTGTFCSTALLITALALVCTLLYLKYKSRRSFIDEKKMPWFSACLYSPGQFILCGICSRRARLYPQPSNQTFWTLAPDFCQRLHCKFDQTQLQLACSRDDRLNHRAHNGLSQHHCYRTNICPKFTPSLCLCQWLGELGHVVVFHSAYVCLPYYYVAYLLPKAQTRQTPHL